MIFAISMAALLPVSKPGRHAAFTADRDSVANAMLACLRAATSASARSMQVWPGFRLNDQAILLVNEREGPVILVAVGSPPPGYKLTAAGHSIYQKDGAPPDSLLGLQVGRAWEPAKGIATVVPFQRRACPEMVLHEAFHTYQRLRLRNSARSWGEGTLRFPATSEEPAAVQLLEGHWLAQALASPDPTVRGRSIALAAAAHARFCESVGESACRDV